MKHIMVFHFQLGQVLEEVEEKVLKTYKQTSLTKAFERISDRYRKQSGVFLQTDEERWVYLFTRMPATFSVIYKVLEELKERDRQIVINSFLDVGSGPGTGAWAASEMFGDTLSDLTLIEKDLNFMSVAKELAKQSPFKAFGGIHWKNQDMTSVWNEKPHDLVLLSYSIGEVEEKLWKDFLPLLWENTKKALVIIEPGTPSGYLRMMKIRDFFLTLGAFIWAPCPHHGKCPLIDDWCHFSVRVQRSSLHRKLKSAELGHEDEKFCYLIIGKEKCPSYSQRILRHPIKHSGFFELTLCEKEGIKKTIFSRKEKEKYKEIKKLNWGDVIN